MSCIAILTDFGVSDPYVGVMKGVILGLAPNVPVLDLSHGVPPQDVLAGALLLDGAVDYFPPDTIFLCVVDPGVGSERAVLAARLGPWRFVCPDNGLLSAVMERYALGVAVAATQPAFHLPGPSRTFHGRDIMAPVAAHWACGETMERFGPTLDRPQRLALPRAREAAGRLLGQALYTDHFGNVITSIRGDQLRAGDRVQVGELALELVGTYAEVAPGAPLALVGSTGRLEISLRGGDAARQLAIGRGDPVVVLRAGS